jgi:hypothetical protein
LVVVPPSIDRMNLLDCLLWCRIEFPHFGFEAGAAHFALAASDILLSESLLLAVEAAVKRTVNLLGRKKRPSILSNISMDGLRCLIVS